MTCFESPSMARSRGWYLRCSGGAPDCSEAVTRGARWPAVALLALLAAGCAGLQPTDPSSAAPTAPATPASPPAPSPLEAPVPIAVPPPEPRCGSCAELQAEIAQLRRRLADAESALGDLRAQRLDQAKALEDASRQAARATVRLRRLASRAAAASYIAEVEVAMTSARSAAGLASGLASAQASGQAQLELAQLELAQQTLDSSREPFARGDYDAAIDRASQAAEMIARAEETPRPTAGDRTRVAVHFAQPMPLRVLVDSNLRQGPGNDAAIRDVLTAGTPLSAYGRRGAWFRVETADGRSGWVYRNLLGPRTAGLPGAPGWAQ